MNSYHPKHLAALTLLLSTSIAHTQGTESDWLEQTEGHKGKVIGAQIMDIQTNPRDGRQMVTVAIPKAAVTNPNDIDEIVVVAKKPKPREPLTDVDYQWVSDYDRDHFGLIIHLSKNTQWPIRLYMSSGAEHHPYNP